MIWWGEGVVVQGGKDDGGVVKLFLEVRRGHISKTERSDVS